MKEELTPVVFGVWLSHPRRCLALLPEITAGLDFEDLCQSYQHIGQHTAADYYLCIRKTRPALPEEYAELKAELEGRGYNLQVIKRATRKHHDARRNAPS